MANFVFEQRARVQDFEFDYGGFGTIYVSFSFNVRITIYENPPGGNVVGLLECWFDQHDRARASLEPDSLTGTGGGFWNAAGVMWGDGSFHRVESPLYDPQYDSQSNMIADLDAATSDYFVRFSFCDSDPDPDLYVSAPEGAHFSRNITTSDLDSQGNLKPLVLAKMFDRSYYHPADVGPDNAAIVAYAGDISSDAMGINWKYYPWARMISGAWQSCNRDIDTPTGSRTAYLRHMESSSWADVLNDIQGTTQMAWRMQNGSWRIAAPYGNNA